MAFSRYCALVAASLLGNALGCGSAPAAKSPSSGSEQEEREASGGAEAADEGVEGADDSAEAPVQSKPPKPGTQALDQRGLKMEFALTLMRGDAAAGVQTGNWSFDEERTHRVIESSDTAITKLQVVYGKWEAKPLLGLTYEVPTDGNSYMVTADGGITLTTPVPRELRHQRNALSVRVIEYRPSNEREVNPTASSMRAPSSSTRSSAPFPALTTARAP